MNSKLEGVGLGLRFPHFESVLQENCQTPWFEVLADDFLSEGPHCEKLHQLRDTKPIVLHTIGMNIGGVEPLDRQYLKQLRDIYEIFQPEWVSDHLCWSAHAGYYHHDLLPIPRTNEALENACERISFIQDFMARPLVLENITSYVEFQSSEISEPEFISEIVARTGCGLLLDLTNVLVNSENKKTSAIEYIKNFPMKSVQQIHLAGGEYSSGLLVDTHGSQVGEADIALLKKVYETHPGIPVMIERDTQLPSFEELESERLKISEAVYGI